MKSGTYIFLLSSLLLFVYSMWVATPIVVNITDLLGPASHLPLTYWLGLLLLSLCFIKALFCRNKTTDAIFLFMTFVFGLYFFGIASFGYTLPRDPGVYYPTVEAEKLTLTGHIDSTIPHHPMTYWDWPGIHFLSVTLLSITGLDILTILKFAPLYWVMLFVLMTYTISKRLQLPAKSRRLLPVFMVSSYWLMWSGYSPQSIVILPYLLCFALSAKNKQIKNNAAELVLIFISFTMIVITHSITTITTILGIWGIGVYKKDIRLISVSSIIFGSWYLYQAHTTFSLGITQWISQPLALMFKSLESTVPSTLAATSLGRNIDRFCKLSYTALYFGFTITTVILSWTRKESVRRNLLSPVIWLFAGIFPLLLFLPIGRERTDILFRLYMYGLAPMAAIILSRYWSRKILVFVMTLFIVFHMPAHYCAEAAWGQVYESEFQGAKFVSLRAELRGSYFYSSSDTIKLLFFHNPQWVNVPGDYPEHYPTPNEIGLGLYNASYIFIGAQGHFRMLWSYGTDPLENLLRIGAQERCLSLAYDNGDFKAYTH